MNAGIPDYRGTQGVDTLSHLSQRPKDREKGKKKEKEEEEEEDVDYTKLMPTPSHLAITSLIEDGLANYVITQNCDSLHLRAGTPRHALTELHGNVFVEYCERCMREYVRDFEVDLYSTSCYKEKWWVRCSTCGLNHYTGRLCEDKCVLLCVCVSF